ncbi:MAG: 5'-3' exonuclease H3TH domain-containing protein [Actinomycetota bacterium]
MIRGGARAHSRVDRTVVPARPDALRGSSDVGLFEQDVPALFLVDGNNLLWRAAHGHPAPFAADDGRDLTPLFRFIVLLRRALGTYGLFAECVVCFDGAEAWSGRLDVDASYKGNRRYENADLSFMGWLPEIRAALGGAGVASVELTNSEADDVIATFASRAGPRHVRILSTDRDYYQLISATTTVVSPKERPPLVTEETLVDRYRVTASQWCDFRALAGDQSDGIPGLPGVGMKKAAAVLAGGRTLDDLRELGVDGSPTGAVVMERWEDLSRWRDLIRLRTDVDVGFQPLGEPTPRLPSPSAVCSELGLIT